MKLILIFLFVLSLSGCGGDNSSYPRNTWNGSVKDSVGNVSVASLSWPMPPGYAPTLPGKQTANLNFVDSQKGQINCQCNVALDGNDKEGTFQNNSCSDTSGHGFDCATLMGASGRYEFIVNDLHLQGGAEGYWSK